MTKLLYAIIYCIFYLISLLPWRCLYWLSDLIAFLVEKIFKYRVDVVKGNLKKAFPEKTDAEIEAIQRQFYHNFVDAFIEMIKLLSIGKKSLRKRVQLNDRYLQEIFNNTNKSAIFVLSHSFNWELVNLRYSIDNPFKQVAVYKDISSKVFDKLMYRLRSKFRTRLISVYNFRNQFKEFEKQRFALCLVADQNPHSDINKAYWVSFFGQPLPFLKGSEVNAKYYDAAVMYLDVRRGAKRGHYTSEAKLICLHPNELPAGEITKRIVKAFEDNIKSEPSNYLWSHRRFHYIYNDTFAKKLIQ